MSVATNPDDEQVHLPGAANRKVMRETHTAHAPEFSPYLERGIVDNLRSGSGKSRQREIAVLRHGRERLGMKMNAYGRPLKRPCCRTQQLTRRPRLTPIAA